MIIGVHILQHQPHLLQTFLQIAHSKPNDSFIIFCKEPIPQLPANCSQQLKTPAATHYVTLQFWYAATLPRLIKQLNIQVFVSNANRLCAKTTIPQYLYVDVNYNENIQYLLGKYHFKKALSTATKIITNELFVKQQLCTNYSVSEQKVTNIYHGLQTTALQQISFTIAQQLKDTYTQGYDYFIYQVDVTSAVHLINILKAFSQFKKWQKSSIKLVLLLNGQQPEMLIKDFKNYKYKSEVFFIDQANEMATMLIPCAFAMIYFGNQSTASFAITALQHQVPIIAEDTSVNKALLQNAFLPTPTTENDIALQIQTLYKDEALRGHLQQQGQQIIQLYNIETAATNLYNTITT